MKIVHAAWEKHNLGVNAFEIFLDDEDTLEQFAVAQENLIREGGTYFAVKTPVNRGDLLFGLPKLGYTYVETVFRIAIEREEYHIPTSIARFDRQLRVQKRTTEEQQQAVFARIQEGVFKSDRISLDPNFAEGKSAARYINWIKQILDQGGELYEMLHRDTPAGLFIIKRIDAETVDPVLMGLYREETNRGLGTLLHKKTLDTCFAKECARVTSTFVSNNAKILRVYVNVGASITDLLYTYIKHINA